MKTATESIVKVEKGPIAPLKVKQVLLGLGFNETDEMVLKYFGYFSSHIPTEAACFVHVIPAIYLFDQKNGVDSHLFDQYEMSDELALQLAKKIATEITDRSEVKTSFDIREGNPLDELMQEAENMEADLVVIGKNTRKESHGILAKNFARKVNSNALFIPDKAKTSMRKILVPVDFSPNSIEALRTAVSLSKCYKIPPKIVALNIYEMPVFPAYLVRKTEDEMRKILINDRKAAFKSFLNTYIPAEDHEHITTDIIEQTHPGVGNFIVDYAGQNKADLIVIGARGHSKVGLLLLGSVTEKVLSLTRRVAVMVVK
jgi:nucleotide-binding universal stress UspA family protein